MAEQDTNIVPADLFAKIGTSEDTQRALMIANSRLNLASKARSEVSVLDDGYIDVEIIDSLIAAHVKGEEGLPEQTVTVEYLRGNQRMIIPAILAMSWDENMGEWAKTNTTLQQRYHKLASLTYTQIKALCVLGKPLSDASAAIDAVAMPVRPADGCKQFLQWLQPSYYENAAGESEVITVFSYVSAAAQMNADVRDFGMLLHDEMVKTDDEWKTADKVTEISVKLRPYTLQNVAALNYDRVNNLPLAAWVRAYGLSVGIMPARSSLTVIEYIFSTRMPNKDARKIVRKWRKEYQRNASEICCNILAMFGLLHLNKDHTHRTNDASMRRIQKSYIGAIRTATTDSVNESMHAHAEEIARTASHPFGLAQTYWFALAMGHLCKLAAPLALRVNTCPPPVQRLLIVNATLKEWANLPAGQMLNDAFSEEFATVVREVDTVRQSPPSYSGLFRLYGIEKMMVMSQKAIDAVGALIPPIYGYVMLTRSGAALALSWSNIKRDHSAVLLDCWRNLWSRYFKGKETQEMMGFAMSTKMAQMEYRRLLEAAKERRKD